MVPISMPYINPNYISTEDMEELSHPKPSNQDKPHSHKAPIQSHDYTIGIASQKSKTENGPQESHPKQKEGDKVVVDSN